ncbi:hypothetical protein DOY81_009694 [Sarcophaga bullata]|nr:hypothetical protein DOY81_009694 [Sarcophaga bullata]
MNAKTRKGKNSTPTTIEQHTYVPPHTIIHIVVRAASPGFNCVSLHWVPFFIYCTNIVMYPNPNLYTCTARIWLREIGFSLTYGALMLKTWRRPKTKASFKGVYRHIGDISLEVVFLAWGVRLCIMVRKAPSEFNESRFISMAIYNEFLLTCFLNVSMLFLQSPANPDLLYIIFFCHTQLTITLLLALIFGSKSHQENIGMGAKSSGAKFNFRPQVRTFANPSSVTTSTVPVAVTTSAGPLIAYCKGAGNMGLSMLRHNTAIRFLFNV